MSDGVELTVGLCAHQEATNLLALLPRINDAARQLTNSFEVLVVDALTPLDDTEAVCSKHGVRYVRRRGGHMYADAVRTMIAEAKGQYLINMDADGSHRPGDLAALWRARFRFEIVIGSRYVDRAQSNNPVRLRWMSSCLNAGLRKCVRSSVRDLTNSFRLYRTELLADIDLRSTHFEVLQEVLVLAQRQHPGLRIGEVPVVFEKRKNGHSKRKLWRFLLSYVRLFVMLRRK